MLTLVVVVALGAALKLVRNLTVVIAARSLTMGTRQVLRIHHSVSILGHIIRTCFTIEKIAIQNLLRF